MRNVNGCVSIVLLLLFLVSSCQKETSFEGDITQATGSLHSDASDECLPKNVAGAFIANKELTEDNYLEVEVEVVTPGIYSIVSDTINGYYFKGTGRFSSTGTHTIKLKANGMPVTEGTNTFLIQFDSSFCSVPVTVLPAGTGEASFTLAGSGSACISATISGIYSAGTELTLSNNVVIRVNVTKIGTYFISTSLNGITFKSEGVLTATGTQYITLTGEGTPETAGLNVFTVTAGISSCTFTINVQGTVATSDYFPRTPGSNWSYEFDDSEIDSLYRTVIPSTVNVHSNTYNVFAQSENFASGFDSSGYYRKSGGNYYEYIDVSTITGFDDPQWTEYVFLKDDVSSGTSWTAGPFTGTVTPLGELTIRMRFTILKKNESVTVDGTVYPNTIVVEQRPEQYSGNTWVDLSASTGTIKSYYAKNVGLIKQEVVNAFGVTTTKLELRRFEIY